MKNLIYDYETLGQNPQTTPIVCLALLEYDTNRFNDDSKYTYDELYDMIKYYKFDIQEQITKYNKVVEKPAIEWWSKKPKNIQDRLLKPSDEDVSIFSLPNIFGTFNYSNISKVYTRGNSFDPVFTTSIFKTLNKDVPYKYWQIRDTRSYIEGLMLTLGIKARNDFTPTELVGKDLEKHDPRVDVVLDVLRMQELSIMANVVQKQLCNILKDSKSNG